MDEFLEKLQEDQRRMRRYLRAHGAPFKQMGEALAASRARRSRIFVVGEPPLDALISLLAEDYLTHLPALPVDLSRPGSPSVDPDSNDDVDSGRMAAAKQVGRHLHPGDVVLAFLMDGADRETRAILEAARAKRVNVLVIGGLGAKGAVRRLASVRLSLPTHGVKTIVESVFICARILARVSRAASRVGAEPVGEEEHLVQVGCDTCQERVFHEQRMRGREVPCPLCQAPMKVPRDSVRRGASQGPAVAPPQETGQQKRRRLKPSVLEVKAPKLEDLPSDPEDALETDEGEIEVTESPPSRTTPKSGSHSRPSRSDMRSDVGKAIPRGNEPTRSPSRTPRPAPTPAPDSGPVPVAARDESPRPTLANAPVGLTSHEQPAHGPEPSFGSDIMVGSDVVPKLPHSGRQAVLTTTASADPFALEDAFLADLEMPDDNRKSASGQSDSGEVSRRLSARFTIAECRMRWGRGGFPDESGPTHEMISLSQTRLEFFLDPDDEGGSTLQKGDELWLRLEIPAFIEPVMAQGILIGISGTSGDGRRGTRVELEFQDLDPVVRRKLARAAESMGAPA